MNHMHNVRCVRNLLIYLEVIITHRKKIRVLVMNNMKWTLFCVVVPCSLLEIDRRFRGSYRFHHQGVPGLKLAESRASQVFCSLPQTEAEFSFQKSVIL
jgi:hypothetical protein